jgi:hypothetical protein
MEVEMRVTNFGLKFVMLPEKKNITRIFMY